MEHVWWSPPVQTSFTWIHSSDHTNLTEPHSPTVQAPPDGWWFPGESESTGPLRVAPCAPRPCGIPGRGVASLGFKAVVVGGPSLRRKSYKVWCLIMGLKPVTPQGEAQGLRSLLTVGGRVRAGACARLSMLAFPGLPGLWALLDSFGAGGVVLFCLFASFFLRKLFHM